MTGQLATALPGEDGRQSLVVSAAREVEEGRRVMLLHLPGLLRLDVAPAGDTLRTIVRNLSDGELTASPPPLGGYVLAEEAPGLELAALRPSRLPIAYELIDAEGTVEVRGQIALIHDDERGLTRFTVQALVSGTTTIGA